MSNNYNSYNTQNNHSSTSPPIPMISSGNKSQSLIRIDIQSAIEEERKEVESNQKRVQELAVKGNSNAYFAFMDGEKRLDLDVTDDENEIMVQMDRMIKVCKQYLGLYRYRFPGPPYNEQASIALLSICNDVRVKADHVIDLLEYGADPNYHNGSRHNETPLFGLIRCSNITAVKAIINAGANLSYLDDICRTPLMYACDSKQHGERVDLVRYLLSLPESRKLLEVRDVGGNSALLNAIFNTNIWIVRELLLAGASVLHRGTGRLAERAGSSAYETAKWIYMVGIGIDPSLKLLPLSLEYPGSFLYRHFSLKARYDYDILLRFQSIWKYSEELIFRMIVRKKIEEERLPTALANSSIISRQQQGLMEAEFPMSQEEFDREMALNSRRYKKAIKIQAFRDIQYRKGLDAWNKKRMQFAQKIDDEYTENLRGQRNSNLVDWVKKTVVLPPPPRAATKQSRKRSRQRVRTPGTSISVKFSESGAGEVSASKTADPRDDLPSSFAGGGSVPDPMSKHGGGGQAEAANAEDGVVKTWVKQAKFRGVYAPVPIHIPKTEVPMLDLGGPTRNPKSRDESKDEEMDDLQLFEQNIALHPVDSPYRSPLRHHHHHHEQGEHGSNPPALPLPNPATASNSGWKSATVPQSKKLNLDGVWTPAFSLHKTMFSDSSSQGNADVPISDSVTFHSSATHLHSRSEKTSSPQHRSQDGIRRSVSIDVPESD